MSQILIINAHEPTPFSEGKLNASLVTKAQDLLSNKGHQVKVVTMQDEIIADDQLELFQWADRVIIQAPVYWMSVPAAFKKYIDDVFTAGMADGRLCNFDGRTRTEPTKNYGTGGTQTNTKYMISLTFNAPKEAFDDADEYLFQGKGVDDLMFPLHSTFRFFGMKKIPTFSCFDVMKNADLDNDFQRFEQHLLAHF